VRVLVPVGLMEMGASEVEEGRRSGLWFVVELDRVVGNKAGVVAGMVEGVSEVEPTLSAEDDERTFSDVETEAVSELPDELVEPEDVSELSKLVVWLVPADVVRVSESDILSEAVVEADSDDELADVVGCGRIALLVDESVALGDVGNKDDVDNVVVGSNVDADNVVVGSNVDVDHVVVGSNVDVDNIVVGSNVDADNVVVGSNVDVGNTLEVDNKLLRKLLKELVDKISVVETVGKVSVADVDCEVDAAVEEALVARGIGITSIDDDEELDDTSPADVVAVEDPVTLAEVEVVVWRIPRVREVSLVDNEAVELVCVAEVGVVELPIIVDKPIVIPELASEVVPDVESLEVREVDTADVELADGDTITSGMIPEEATAEVAPVELPLEDPVSEVDEAVVVGSSIVVEVPPVAVTTVVELADVVSLDAEVLFDEASTTTKGSTEVPVEVVAAEVVVAAAEVVEAAAAERLEAMEVSPSTA
jgi:hypothetical protein